jgi:3-oxoacyl-[acyl-carrier-protein] synthase III
MKLLYQREPVFVSGFSYKLGSVRRTLDEVKASGLLAGSVETLSAMGYRYCLGLAEGETLLDLAIEPLRSALTSAGSPRALVVQHCHAENTVMPCEPGDTIGASRNRYLAAELMQSLGIDHLPYLCSFASGCAGFLSLLITAGGLASAVDDRPIACLMADCRPAGVPFDLLRERILGSDHSSAFSVGREKQSYQLLGISYYSTTRRLVPLVEIVKRTVEMIQTLADDLGLNLAASDVALHYPNTFPDTWKMVTRYLQTGKAQHIMDEMPERAHCGATDSVISLAKWHRGQSGRLHVVVNYGVGLHLGVCLLREESVAAKESPEMPA